MNALKILLIISLIIYLTIYETSFWKVFFSCLIPYYLYSQFIYPNNKYDTPKSRTLISLWSHPFNPQINSMLKVEITKLEQYLSEYSKKIGKSISIMDYMIYIYVKMMIKYPKINGSINFGKVIIKIINHSLCLGIQWTLVFQ
jgi:hypothetical protein